jgi:hypothetical protein
MTACNVKDANSQNMNASAVKNAARPLIRHVIDCAVSHVRIAMTTTTKPEFQFHKATRESIRLLIAVSGGTGSGKSYSALRLAKGLANGKKFAAIDTENGRLSMYADDFDFDVVDFHAPFTPARYLEAIQAAEKLGHEVIVVDSGSHVWDGDGGVLDMQVEELDRLVERARKAGDNREDWQIEEAQRMRSWIYPKMEHKKMMTKLLQLKAHVIMCLRAAERIEITKDGRKTVVRPKQSLTGLDGWIPICDAKLPFEFTASFLLTADKPGVPRPIKLQERHKQFFPLDKPITEEAGRLIGEWAKGSPVPPAGAGVSIGEGSRTVETQGTGVTNPIELFKAIDAASTLAALQALKPLIRKFPMTDGDKRTAIELMTAKHKQLTQQAEEIPL